MKQNNEKARELVRILNLIEDRPEQLSEEKLRKMFGKVRYNFFSQNCLGGKDPLVLPHPDGFKLSQMGSRKLRDMEWRLADLDSKNKQTRTNNNIFVATSILAAGIVLENIDEILLAIHSFFAPAMKHYADPYLVLLNTWLIPFAKVGLFLLIIKAFSSIDYGPKKKKNRNFVSRLLRRFFKSSFNPRLRKKYSSIRLFKAFLFAVTIGIGAFLGKWFLTIHWFLALVAVTVFLWVTAGNLLDVLFPWD